MRRGRKTNQKSWNGLGSKKASSEGTPWEEERELGKVQLRRAGAECDEEKPPLCGWEGWPQPELLGMHGGKGMTARTRKSNIMRKEEAI